MAHRVRIYRVSRKQIFVAFNPIFGFLGTQMDHVCSKHHTEPLQEGEAVCSFFIPSLWYRSKFFANREGICIESMIASFFRHRDADPDTPEYYFALAFEGFILKIVMFMEEECIRGKEVLHEFIPFVVDACQKRTPEGPFLPEGITSMFFISVPESASIELRVTYLKCKLLFYYDVFDVEPSS